MCSNLTIKTPERRHTFFYVSGECSGLLSKFDKQGMVVGMGFRKLFKLVRISYPFEVYIERYSDVFMKNSSTAETYSKA